MENSHTWLKITEAALKMRTSTRRVRYLLDKGELIDNGKKGSSRRVRIPAAELANNNRAPRQSLKDQLTAAQIQKISQQISDGRAAIRQELLNEIMTECYNRMKPLKALIISLGLTPAQTEILNTEWKKAFPNV